MKIITELIEANSILKVYENSNFQVVMYTSSLKKICIRLSKLNKSEILYIVGIGCESINGRFSYLNCNLSISEQSNNLTIIDDKKSDFNLLTTGGFSIALGEENEFGNSFENFLSQ